MEKGIKLIITIVLMFVFFIIDDVNATMTKNTYSSIVSGKSIEYYVYTPTSVNSNTKVIIYSTEPGSHSDLDSAIKNSNLNSIVVLYNNKSDTSGNSYIDPPVMSELANSIMINLKQLYNLSSDNYISDGFSQKTWTSISGLAGYLKNHPTSRQLVLANDGSPRNINTNTDLIPSSDIAILKENKAFVIDYCQHGGYWKSLTSTVYNSGLDVLFITPDDVPKTDDFNTKHSWINKMSYSSGFYDKLLAFIYDGGDLPATGYKYYVYDNGNIVYLTASEVKLKFARQLAEFRKMGSYKNSSGGGGNTPTPQKPTSYPYECNYSSGYGDYVIKVNKNTALVTSGYMNNVTTVTRNLFDNGCPSSLYLCEINNPYSTDYTTTYAIKLSNDGGGCMSLIYFEGSGGRTPTPTPIPEKKEPIKVNCEYLFGDPDNSNDIAYWLQWTMNLMKYIGIIALFILSTVDFVKALIQNDQDALKKAGMTAAKRFIYCVILFFLPILIDFAMTLLGAYGTCNIG